MNKVPFHRIQGRRAKDMEKVLALEGRPKVAEAMIKGLERNNQSSGKEVAKLEKELSMAKLHKSAADIHLGHIKKRAYEVGFEECRVLVTQILLTYKAHLLQVSIRRQPLVADFAGLD